MKLNQYKMSRSKNFPLPKNKAEHLHKASQSSENIETFALLTEQQPGAYQLHIRDQIKNEIDNSELKERKKSNVILFNDHQYVQRQFDHAFLVPSRQSYSSPVNSERMKAFHTKMEDTKSNILQIIQQNIKLYDRNLFLFPVLDTDTYTQIVFPRVIEKQTGGQTPDLSDNSSKSKAQRKKEQNCLLKSVISSFLESKRDKTIVSLSIMSIQSNGSLIDQLDLDWLSKQKELALSMKQKAKLMVKKYRKEIKTFDLNRQQINSWDEAFQIINNYYQIIDYLQYWRTYEETCQDCNTGEIYQISEVQIDPQYGSILTTVRKTYLLKINQYLSNSNLIMMKISQFLNNLVAKTMPSNYRDYPLTLFLSQCFFPQNQFHINLFTQLGTVQTLKEECICLAMNLQVPGKYQYLKNYCDHKRTANIIKKYAEIFIPKSKEQLALNLREKVKMGRKSLRLYEESEKVNIKSFSYETYSSFNKRKNQLTQKNTEIPEVKDQQEMSLMDVYGANWRVIQLQKKNQSPKKNINQLSQNRRGLDKEDQQKQES